MKYLKSSITVLLLIFSGLTMSGVSYASDDTDKLYTEEGKIDYIDLKTGDLVVADSSYILKPGYLVKSKSGKIVSAFHLKKGRYITMTHTRDGTVKTIRLMK